MPMEDKNWKENTASLLVRFFISHADSPVAKVRATTVYKQPGAQEDVDAQKTEG